MEPGRDRNRRRAPAVTFLIANLRIPVVQIDTLAIDRDLEHFA
jgi:hypothetical protein